MASVGWTPGVVIATVDCLGCSFPQPSCLSVHLLSYGSQLASQFRFTDSFLVSTKSPPGFGRSLSAGQKQIGGGTGRYPIILASSKPDPLFLEQCLTQGPAWVSFSFFLSASGLSLWQDGFWA